MNTCKELTTKTIIGADYKHEITKFKVMNAQGEQIGFIVRTVDIDEKITFFDSYTGKTQSAKNIIREKRNKFLIARRVSLNAAMKLFDN